MHGHCATAPYKEHVDTHATNTRVKKQVLFNYKMRVIQTDKQRAKVYTLPVDVGGPVARFQPERELGRGRPWLPEHPSPPLSLSPAPPPSSPTSRGARGARRTSSARPAGGPTSPV